MSWAKDTKGKKELEKSKVLLSVFLKIYQLKSILNTWIKQSILQINILH